ncbi:MAG: magnesium transporter [Bryobacterales bacterium]|jgi:magnesium transporter|nr:magnesium transporter [Bryobacterales bacterium]
MNWHDIVDPNDAELDRLAAEYHIHPLHIEDCRHGGQRGKVEEGKGYLFVVLKPVQVDPDHELVFHDLDIFLGSDWVITVQEGNRETCGHILQQARAAPVLSASQVLYRIYDGTVDSYLPIMDHIDDVIDGLEERVLQDPDPEVLARIFRTRRALIELRRILANTRDLAAHLYRTPSDLIPADLIPFLRDVYDHVARNLDQVETQRDLLSGTMDVYLSSVANKTNRVMKVLTVVGTIALPALIISGFFGMNLKGLPFTDSSQGTAIVTGIMGLTTTVLLAVVWRLGWF